ncbi:HAMP domain-containing protein [Phormidesmis priestleyi ULC007]|uniref:histidine kinase n=1 Tax=Phormidesmis priestleyi ULC007 TaxID=1920490 RepID=A0A2T1D913_9CYAN|nr:HAMP domain-containing protein [Phormidesmis priestleyi]PSB16924.1 HAMP domain-containing protein [Phormidesmis priestleyi ULC007]PZO47849.1 MAG: HAMP domain-containing protein [Phormidesmis priestleyi]
MKLRSFRFRIALMAAILAGGALVGFGVLSSWLIYEAKVSRLDAELESQLILAGRPRSPDRWQSYEAFLPRAFETSTKNAIALLVIGGDDTVLYRSPAWNPDLNITNLWTSRPPRPMPTAPPTVDRVQPDALRPSDRLPPTPRFITQRTPSGAWRMGSVTTPFTQVAIAVSLNAIDQEMAVIRNIFLISIPGVLLLVAGGAWAIAANSLRSIHQLTTIVGSVTASGLEQRVPIGSTDVEFVQLIQVVNQMLERLERSFKQSSRFSADAAHELKTPLAILQGELEQTIQRVRPLLDTKCL